MNKLKDFGSTDDIMKTTWVIFPQFSKKTIKDYFLTVPKNQNRMNLDSMHRTMRYLRQSQAQKNWTKFLKFAWKLHFVRTHFK